MRIDLDKMAAELTGDRPVLIAGPTASGKSDLALRIHDRFGGVIVNADALQVFANWRILTARPSEQDLARAPHHLYGHVPGDAQYSVGHWLRDVEPFLAGKHRPIIVGGTGLNFTALTEGLADIPPTLDDVRAKADALMAEGGLAAMLADLDAASRDGIDQNNPMRVQRAWEVLQTTGRGIAEWQAETPPPLLPLKDTVPIVLDADRDWLADRIAGRFDVMLEQGALDEARANLPSWDPALPSSKAIGAAELIGYQEGTLSLDAARDSAIITTRQYAKRQRTWFRARMRAWRRIVLPT